MTSGRSQPGGARPPKTRLRQPDAAAGADFCWPPPADDAAGCSIVMLEAEAGQPARSSTPRHEPTEAFADFAVDVETALDAFADLPAKARVSRPVRAAIPRVAPPARRPASWWRAAGMRSVVALGIGASLAVMPAPVRRDVPDVEAVQDIRPVDVPAVAPPRQAAPRTSRMPKGARTPRQSAPRFD
jgi:hypothetical protein